MNEQPEAAFVQIEGLEKKFEMKGGSVVCALNGLHLEIASNSFTVIQGPSGSGKSTLLYLIGGLDKPTAGRLRVDGIELQGMDENALAIYRRRKVGFIFQSFNLVDSMNALQNVAFPMRFAGASNKVRSQRAAQLLKRIGLEKRRFHKPPELSGGQQQRVAIARALINDPPLVLADEPTGNLDTASGYRIMQMLSELHREGRTVVVVTHDPRMEHFATSMVYLLDGKTVSQAEYQTSNDLSKFEPMED